MTTTRVRIAVAGRAPPKPRQWEPCNGCGMCCAASKCEAALIALGTDDDEGPCPILRFHDGRFWCGLVETERAASLLPVIADALGIGSGCQVDNDFWSEVPR